MSLSRAVHKLLRPLLRRVDLMVARAVVRAVNSAARRQRLQISLLDGEVAEDVEHYEPYGFTSHPHPGGGAIALFVAGARAHGLVVCAGGRDYRLQGLDEGEVALYDDQGQKVVLYRDRIEVASPKVVVLSDDVHLGSEGGPRVARIGDRVQVSSGSSAGLWPIVEGSARVSAT